MIIERFIIQLMHNIYVDTIKIIKYLKVLQHVSDHRGSIIREPLTVLGSLTMDPLWSETCWSTFKYFIILIVSIYYILRISWIIKCLILPIKWIDVSCTNLRKRRAIISIHSIKGLFLKPRRGVYCAVRTESSNIIFVTHGCMRSMQCNVEFGKLCINSAFTLRLRKPWWKQPVAGPSTSVLTSCQQFGIKFWPTRQKNSIPTSRCVRN